MNKQISKYNVIFDLELTCWDDRDLTRAHGEIIEIGAVKVNFKTWEEGDRFQAFVKPVKNLVLSDYCENLTGIDQMNIDAADTFPNVFKEFLDWADGPRTYMAWGNDYQCLWKACEDIDSISLFRENKFVNCKPLYTFYTGMTAVGLKKCVRRHGIEMNEIALPFHRALNDSLYTARVMKDAYINY